MLPAADRIVRGCPSAIPITLDQAEVRCVLSPGNLPAIRTSRQAKNLISAAAHHLPGLHDQALTERLRAWIAAKPNLA
ncbi:hypothetical protein [Spongiactinospora sp. TRM90649]|uniref:hypothetical protein n=1 Tax=Spongiactinospora sp. TRM90649 TaxID=3031114 RepID=UPI0023F8637C|nr:hypothetical protein [Spongiactinospora sp. TRM90649]MDF5759370.1 hypothetical protein [Spongiactinospora sp. TRM90649]